MLKDALFRMYGDHAFLEAFIGRYVAEHGQTFTPIARPKGIRKRRDRACFYNAQDCVLSGATDKRFEGAQYVEGFAVSDRCPPMHHGWITFDGRTAIDVTWPEPGRAYLGVVFDVKAIAAHALNTREIGPMLSGIVRPTFDEYYEKNPHLREFYPVP